MGVIINQSLKGSLFSYVGVFIGALNTLILFPYAFADDPSLLGFYNLLLSYGMLLAMFVGFGVQNILLRFIPQSSKEDVPRLNALGLILPLIPLLILTVCSILFKQDVIPWIVDTSYDYAIIEKYYAYILVFTVLNVYFEVFASFSQVRLDASRPLFHREFVRRGFTSLLLVLLLFQWVSFDLFLMLLAVSYLVQILELLRHVVVRKGFRTNFRMAYLPWRKILDYGLFSVLTYGGTLLINRIDIIMISTLIGLEEVAIFTIGLFIGGVIKIPITASAGVIKPILSKALKEDALSEVEMLYRKSSLNQLVIGGWMFAVIWANVWDVFQIIPEKFRGGEYVVLFIGLARLVNLATGINGFLILMSRYYKFIFVSNAFLLIVVIVSNYLLIPMYGITGAALASMISMITDEIIRVVFVKVKFGFFPFDRTFVLLGVLITLVTLVFSRISLDTHFLVNIGVKTVLISGIYVVLIARLKVSEDINQYLSQQLARWKNRLNR